MNGDFLNRLTITPVPPVVVAPRSGATAAKTTPGAGQGSFADVLAKTVVSNPQGIRFSAHAQARLQERGMSLNEKELVRLQQAVDRAGQKGSKDAYVVYGDTGFVVNVPNRTVVTALVNQEDTVVTNIDSVVMLSRLDH